MEAVDARTTLHRRDGAKRAREKLGPLSVSSLQPQRPMELVQIDHTPCLPKEARCLIGEAHIERYLPSFSVSGLDLVILNVCAFDPHNVSAPTLNSLMLPFPRRFD